MSIASEKYVSLVTVRRSGERVASPVWIAPLRDGRAGFTTEADSGKVKRIRNNSSVTVQACTARGKLKPNAPVVSATAMVVTGSSHRDVQDAIRAKYGVIVSLIGIGDKFAKLFGRSKTPTAVVLSFTESDTTAGQ
jgi:PPOX class probable F420-dependent enzyme